MSMQPSEPALSPAPDGIDPQEWPVRCDLAALYRLVAHFRMTDLIDTHISARVPGPEAHFLINRYGVLFEEMRASDLVKVDTPKLPATRRASKVGIRIGDGAPVAAASAGIQSDICAGSSSTTL